MSFSLGGSQGSATEETRLREEIRLRQEREQQQIGRRTGTQRQERQQREESTLFSAPTLTMLEDLVAQLKPQAGAGQTGASQAAGQASALQARAGTAAQDIEGLISPIMDNARLAGERELQTLQTQLAQQAGGSIGNTFVAGSVGQGRADLESKLAGMESQLKINARDTQTQEMTQAFSALAQNVQANQAGAGQDLQAFLGSLEALKGGRAQRVGAGSTQAISQEESIQQLTDLLTSLTNRDLDSRVDSRQRGMTAGLSI